MNYLVIYDATGFIISRMAGVPYMWIEIPEGKRIVSIDTAKEKHEPVFGDIPKSEIDVLRETVDMLVLSMLEV